MSFLSCAILWPIATSIGDKSAPGLSNVAANVIFNAMSTRKMTRRFRSIAGRAHAQLLLLSSTLLIALLLLPACLPLRFTTSPGALGVVVDEQTRAPIAGAEVVVSRSTYPPASVGEAITNSRPPAITTETNGTFSIPPERAWDFFVIPVDAFPHLGLLVVKHDGYDPVMVPFWSRSTKPLGEVLMKPSANPGK
jgi:hypothetical protein